MDYNYSIIKHLTNDECKYVCHANVLCLIKDHLPDGTPCWRQPTKEEKEQFEKERNQHEI